MKFFYTPSGVRMENDESNSSDDATNDPSNAIEGGYFNLDTVITVEENGKNEKTPLTPSPQPMGKRIRALWKGLKEEAISYDALSGKPKDVRRNLGVFAGVFAPVALGQFANNLFLRTGEYSLFFLRPTSIRKKSIPSFDIIRRLSSPPLL